MSQPEAAVVAGSYLTLHYRVSVEAGPDAERSADATATPGGTANASGTAIVSGSASGDDVVSTFGSRPATLQLGAGQLSPALEERLLGLPVGAHRVFELSAGEAFGPRNPDLVQRLSRTVLESESGSTDYVPGDVVEFNAPGGGRYAGVFRSLDDDDAIFDFNHPLAGQAVRFEVQILGIL